MLMAARAVVQRASLYCRMPEKGQSRLSPFPVPESHPLKEGFSSRNFQALQMRIPVYPS